MNTTKIVMLILFLIVTAAAQYNFNLSCLSDTFQSVGNNGVAQFRFCLTNTGSVNDVYELKCLIIESVPGWFVTLCVKGNCILPGTNVFDTINVGQSDTTITITVYTTSLPGREIVILKVRSLGNPNKQDSIRVYTQLGQGIEQNLNQSDELFSSFRIYPNPSKSNTTISLTNIETYQPRFISIAIYDINGELVKSYAYIPDTKILWDGRNKSGKSVSDGNYIVAIRRNGQIIAAKPMKFVK
ncbi:MAG: T9SS type A sorting domain-containing protein [candidate division WOR-3 bacterium]